MTIELRHVVKRVGAEMHIHETSVAFESDGFNIQWRERPSRRIDSFIAPRGCLTNTKSR